jgi:MFS family permease
MSALPNQIERRNFFLLVAGASIMNFGWVIPGIIRMPYFNWLGMSNAVIGLTGLAWGLCIIGNFLSPSLSRHFPRKKWFQFFITMPYLGIDLCFGITIIIAIWTKNYSWLLPCSVVLAFLWPLMAGWTAGPLSEYIANCVSKQNISKFVTAQQFGGAVMGFAGAAMMTYLMEYFDMPLRYAFGFLFAYAIAVIANIIPLFAKETPSPQPPAEPFWMPAINAVRNDPRFLRFLAVEFFLSCLVLFPQLFVPLYAVRELGMADQVAASYWTAYTAATMFGALLAGWISVRLGFLKAIYTMAAFFLLSMILLVWPQSRAMQADTFSMKWTLESNSFVPAYQKMAALPASPNFFVMHADIAMPTQGNIEVKVIFNKQVATNSFSINDVVFKDSHGTRLDVNSISVVDTAENKEWIISFKNVKAIDQEYNFELLPYITDTDGHTLDTNGDEIAPQDHYRFLLVGVLYGTAFAMLSVALESLMYLFAPADRRAGYYSAFRIIQFAAPMISYYASGLCFAKGNYPFIFGVLGVVTVLLLLVVRHLLRPLRDMLVAGDGAGNQDASATCGG